LNPATVVGTVMSNGGFAKYMADRGITLERAPVGDKYVAQRIAETSARIGGEQSGHIIFPEQGPTGDGLVTMLQLFRVLHAEGRPAAEFYDEFENWPQLMVNIGVKSKDGWQEAIAEELAQAEHDLGERGRVNVRPSGTEAKIRVMVEADDIELRDRVAESLVEPLVAKLGGEVRGRVDLTHALGD
jgi:phosphoglucosamine mutase